MEIWHFISVSCVDLKKSPNWNGKCSWEEVAGGTLYLKSFIFWGYKMASGQPLFVVGAVVLVWSRGLMWRVVVWCSAAPPWPFLSPPAGCSPVAAELNHCEHGRHSLFTCGLSPAAAQPGCTSICSWQRAGWVCLRAGMQIRDMGVTVCVS